MSKSLTIINSFMNTFRQKSYKKNEETESC